MEEREDLKNLARRESSGLGHNGFFACVRYEHGTLDIVFAKDGDVMHETFAPVDSDFWERVRQCIWTDN